MRQALLVIGFVAYSLLATAQGPAGGGKNLVGEKFILVKTLGQKEKADLDQLMFQYGVFRDGSSNFYVPTLEDFERTYRISLASRLSGVYEQYRESHNAGVVGATITMHYVSGNAGFMMGMMGGMPFTDCAREEVERCELNPNSKATWEFQLNRSADCLVGVADEVQKKRDLPGTKKTNAQCANELRKFVRAYRSKISSMTQAMDPAKTPGVRGGSVKKESAPPKSKGKS